MFIDYLDNTSSLVGLVHPERAGWTATNMLLADIIDNTRILLWLNTQDAQDGRNFPDPVVRPGYSKPEPRKGSRVKAQPLSRIKEIYGEKPQDADRQQKLAKLFRNG